MKPLQIRNASRGLLLAAACLTATLHADPYAAAVLSDTPVGYYSLGDPLPVDVAINQGSLGAALNGVFTNVTHRVPGTLFNNDNTASNFVGVPGADLTKSGKVLIPNNPALNPPANQPFTIEAWLRPTVIENLSAGQAPISNRKTSGDRQGWVFFQRSEASGWNFLMYGGSGSSVSVNVTGGSYVIGEWCHVVVVWNGSTAKMYVDGVSQPGWTSAPGTYLPNTTTPLSIGAYSDPAGSNPFTGDIDEVAFYPSALTEAQIVEHYDNAKGFVSFPESYQAMVKGDGAILHQRMDEYDAGRAVALNSGTLAPQGNAIHFPGVTHSVPGALAAGGDTAMRYDGVDKTSNDVNYATAIPYDARMHTESFSWEGWVRPTQEGKGNAQAVFMNYLSSGDRVGWVLWQRGSRAATGGDRGWNLRMYSANGDQRFVDIITGNAAGGYDLNAWQHLAITYDATNKTAIFYVNGVPVGTQIGDPAKTYAPNNGIVTPAIGGFANGRENPFYGDIDEVALYDRALTPTLVAQHYATGINPAPVTSYPALIAQDAPVAYYRLNEAIKAPAANLGTLGAAAIGTYVNSPAPIDGPNAPAYKGFDAGNKASQFRGNASYVELNNPAGLNIAGPLTLEAWVQPAALQANLSNVIIGHGSNDNFTGEVYLRLENGNYEVGGNGGKASVAAPAGDLGSTAWIHLAGTWSAGTWTLYRNGEALATGADATGPVAVANANWAIGARGRWKEGIPTFPAPPPSTDHRVFTGGIADAAIYNKALSAERVKSHFFAGIGPVPLAITLPSGAVRLEWAGNGILQQSDNLGGWADVPGATSPYTPADGPRHFYRLRY